MEVLLFFGALVLFLVAYVTCFYRPGKYLLTYLKLPMFLLEDIFFSSVTGMMLFLSLWYVLGWLHLFPVGIVLIGAIGILAVRQKLYRLPLLVGIVAACIFSLPALTSWIVGDSVRLLGINSGDGIWHLSLIHE